MNQYENLSLIYDKMIDVDYDKWIKSISEYFKHRGTELKGKKALEIGCGTGNMTLRLKESGMDVIAMDLSEEMLAAAEEKLWDKRYRVMFLNQDCVDFSIDKKFNFAFAFCDVYNYIIDEEELLLSFKNIYNHLEPGGYFIFDISSEYKLKKVIGNNTFTMNRDDLCYIWDNYLEDDLVEMYITFFLQEGELYRRVDENHVQRAYSSDFMVKALKEAGFVDIEVYSDYSLEKLKEEDIRVTFIARKQEE